MQQFSVGRPASTGQGRSGGPSRGRRPVCVVPNEAACWRGGGSLINAGVVLRPDPRVFADEIWPGQIVQDGLLDEGYHRAERWLRPASDPVASEHLKFKALAKASRALGAEPVAPRVAVTFEATINAAGLAQ